MLPVDEIVEPGFEIFRPRVAVVDVIGVLPNIAAEQRPAAMNERVLAVRRLGHFELAVLVEGEPAPARAELTLAGLDEVLAEFVEAAEIAVDQRQDRARHLLAAAVLLHPRPELDVIEVLGRVVEDSGVLAEALLDDGLEVLALVVGAFDEVVQLVHVSLVMLVVVIFERFGRHVRLKRVVIIGKGWEFECHDGSPGDFEWVKRGKTAES